MSTPGPGLRLLGLLRGEAGVGKSALLEYLVRHATGCGIARAAGVESEMELAFAGLHQLCAPFVDRLERLPGPQREALGTAFGVRDGDAPDRFLVGLAVLSLLSDVAEERPLVCVVDDSQWLDGASAQALAFVARRLGEESVGLVFAARGERRFKGLAELVVEGLDDHDARTLLEVVAGPLDERVRVRILAEARGNPPALLELPRGRAPAAAPATDVGLIEFGAQVRFRRPLVRSAVYRTRCAAAKGSGSSPTTGAAHSATTASAATRTPWPPPSGPRRTRAGWVYRSGWCPSSSRRSCAAVGPSAPPARSLASARSPRPAAPSGLSRTMLAAPRCSPRERPLEERYLEAIERLSRIHARGSETLARAHLLYGGWLRRERRRVDAREQLRVAHTMLAELGMDAFAERARRELQAAGETVRKRALDTLDELTPQEAQIAHLAAEGQTNPEIGGRLFLSPRTVEWHLRKVFGKLGISSRKELRAALSDVGAAAAAVPV